MAVEAPESKGQDLSQIRYIISDWDGTLVDSMSSYVQCFIKTLNEFNIEDKKLKEYFLATAGTALSRQIREAVKRFADKTIDDTKDFEDAFFQNFLKQGEIDVIEGAREALDKLKDNGYKIAVWSGTRTDILGQKLYQTRLREFVDFYIGNVPGDDKLVKGPALFKMIAEHFYVSSDELRGKSISIGDGIGDIIAGQQSGMLTIGLGVNRAQLKDKGANFIIKRFRDLPSLLGI